jgi:hypothetical protein
MRVWVVMEGHVAEGGSPLAVLSYEPSKAEMAAILERRSNYEPAERKEWCRAFKYSFEVDDAATGRTKYKHREMKAAR